MFNNAAASTSGTKTSYRNVSIPVWRDPSHMNAVQFPHSDSSANAAEQGMMPHGDASANALEHAAGEHSTSGGAYLTPQEFKEADAYNQFYTLMSDPTAFRQFAAAAVQSGQLSPAQVMDAGSVQKAWNQMVTWAVDYKQLKGVEMTPLEMAQFVGQTTGAAALANQNYVRDHLTGTRVQNDQTIDQKTPSESTLHDLLGRNPTQAELIAYNHGVEQTAAAHPLNREIQTHYVQGQPDAQTVTYTGGYDQHAAEIASAQGASPEVIQNQAATTYYNALVNAIRPAA
jgi:hypothetical protein